MRIKSVFLSFVSVFLFQGIVHAQGTGTLGFGSSNGTDVSPDTRSAAIAEARRLKNIYKTEAAVELLSSLLENGLYDAEVLNELAECHMQAGDYISAASTYSMLSLGEPYNVLYKVRLMNLDYRQKNYRSSASIGQSIFQLDTIPAMISLTADSFNQMAAYDSALVWYGRYLEINPYNSDVISKAAKIHLDRKDYDRVLELTGAYLQNNPSDMDIRGIKGLAYYLKGDYMKSEEVFQEMENEGNDSYNVHFYLGQNQWHNNRPFYARKELEKAWQIDSSDVNLAYTMAAVILESGQTIDAAGPWLDKAIEMISPDPSTLGRIYREYALGYMRSENFRLAIEYYSKSYELDMKSFSVLSSIGYCYERLKDWKHSKEYYELYLKQGRPGTSGYDYAKSALDYVKQQMFMEEK